MTFVTELILLIAYEDKLVVGTKAIEQAMKTELELQKAQSEIEQKRVYYKHDLNLF
jgi:hypothetical protein